MVDCARGAKVHRRMRIRNCFLGGLAVSLISSIFIPMNVASAASQLVPSPVQLPTTMDDGPIPNAVATSVACTTSSNCVAVGQFQDQIGITHSMTLQLSGGNWTAAQELAPTGPPDYTFSDLNSVSCVSTGNCIAVGDYRISTVQTEGFYVVETSGTWVRGQELPLPADAGASPAETTFVSASCAPTGTCELLGEYLTSSPLGIVHSVVDTYKFGTGLTGSPQEIYQLPGEQGIALSSVSCPSAGDCMAVGAQASASSETAVYVAENAGTWDNPVGIQNPAAGATPEEYLSSVSCVSAGNCVAGGDYLGSSGNAEGETYTVQADSWGSPVTIGESKSFSNPFVDDISCASTVTSCTVVGAMADQQGALHAATAQMTAGRWGQFAPAAPPINSVPDLELLGVSCLVGVTCTAVGYFNSPGTPGGTEAMGASWTPTIPPASVTALAGSAVNSSTARLTWSAPVNVGSGIDHYEVSATLVGGATRDEGPYTGTSNQLVRGLQPGGRYRFSVVTVATDGQTAPPTTTVITLPATTPGVPKVQSVHSLPFGLRIFWLAPTFNGGAPVTTYRIRVACGGRVKTAHVGGKTHAASITGLPGGVACAVRVGASNRVGNGPLSAATQGRTRT